MSNIVIENTDDFEQIIRNLENTLPDIEFIFNYVDKSIENINGNELWYGKAQETFCNKYKEFRENYTIVNESFENYIKFLKIVVSNYKKALKQINNNIENNSDNLNVN